MNKRQAKKKELKLITIFRNYPHNRKIRRRSHEASIAMARSEHRNFWVDWNRGYPNRMRWKA
jgi:hypothetical protein